MNDDDVLIQWNVENTNLAEKYQVERSDDAMHFNAIGYVDPTSSYLYSFHDVYPLEGTSYYRLRLIETGGYDFSPTVTIRTSAAGYTQVMPSPAHDYIIVKTKVSRTPAQLVDMQGRNYMNFTISNGMRINIAGIPPGLYVLRIKNGEAIKFMKN